MQMLKKYFISIKSVQKKSVPQNWGDRLHNIAGVRVEGVTPDQVCIVADQQGLLNLYEVLDKQFSIDNFLIEEEVVRYF